MHQSRQLDPSLLGKPPPCPPPAAKPFLDAATPHSAAELHKGPSPSSAFSSFPIGACPRPGGSPSRTSDARPSARGRSTRAIGGVRGGGRCTPTWGVARGAHGGARGAVCVVPPRTSDRRLSRPSDCGSGAGPGWAAGLLRHSCGPPTCPQTAFPLQPSGSCVSSRAPSHSAPCTDQDLDSPRPGHLPLVSFPLQRFLAKQLCWSPAQRGRRQSVTCMLGAAGPARPGCPPAAPLGPGPSATAVHPRSGSTAGRCPGAPRVARPRDSSVQKPSGHPCPWRGLGLSGEGDGPPL